MPQRPPTASAWALLRRDETLAAAIGILLAALSLNADYTWLEAMAGAALCLPLAWRSRSPLGVLGVIALAVPAYLVLVPPSPIFQGPAVVALYSVAAHGSRRRTLAVVAVLVPYVIGIVLLFSPDNEGGYLQEIFGEVSALGIALAIGEAVRGQRIVVATIRERAERAEGERDLEARRRVNEERVRIARDVHDVVAHSIATISTQASVGVHVGREEPERAVEVLESIKAVSTQTLHDLQHALGILREDSDQGPTGPSPSIEAVPDLVQRARDSGFPVALRVTGAPAALPAALQVAIYRIVQEGLTNVMRHAGGARATVRIAADDDQVIVDVINDGSGSPTASSSSGSGSGVDGMHQRARALGGTLEAGRGSDGGFRIHAVLPLQEPA